MTECHPYVDFHTHARRGSGIEMLSTEVAESPEAASEEHPERPYSSGIHPWRPDGDLAWRLERIASDTALTAIGECGLDYRCGSDRGRQAEAFAGQLEIARQRALPVILHCVHAFGPVMRALREMKIERAAFHSFIGSAEQAAEALRHGYYLSFSPRSLASSRTRGVLYKVPADRILFETDESGIPVEDVYAAAETIRGEKLRTAVYENYKQLTNG